MEDRNTRLVNRILEIDQIILKAFEEENTYQIRILMEERGMAISQIQQNDLKIEDNLLHSLLNNTRSISEQIQFYLVKYENGLRSIVQSSAAKKAYEVSMMLNAKHR